MRIIGTKQILLDSIELTKPGTIKLGSETWNAKSIDNTVIATGASVEIKSIKGITLYVQKLD